jgi:hypothetical protein
MQTGPPVVVSGSPLDDDALTPPVVVDSPAVVSDVEGSLGELVVDDDDDSASVVGTVVGPAVVLSVVDDVGAIVVGLDDSVVPCVSLSPVPDGSPVESPHAASAGATKEIP